MQLIVVHSIEMQLLNQRGPYRLQLRGGTPALLTVIHVNRHTGSLRQWQITRRVFGQQVEFRMKIRHSINDLSEFEVSG